MVRDLTENEKAKADRTETPIEAELITDAADAGSGEAIQLGPKHLPPVEYHEKNIIFIGEGDPPLSIHGILKAQLPDAETQKQGFYHEKAREIVAHFPRSYKRMVKLGES